MAVAITGVAEDDRLHVAEVRSVPHGVLNSREIGVGD
jgi:hypothetical protein